MRVAVQIRLLLFLFLSPVVAHSAEPRVALVIGNSRYETAVGPLRNTVNDAKAMAKTLQSLGFIVIEIDKVTRDELMRAVIKFRTKLTGAGVGVFFREVHKESDQTPHLRGTARGVLSTHADGRNIYAAAF